MFNIKRDSADLLEGTAPALLPPCSCLGSLQDAGALGMEALSWVYVYSKLRECVARICRAKHQRGQQALPLC